MNNFKDYNIFVLILFITLTITFTLEAGVIKYNKSSDKFKIYNKKSKKIISYYKVLPGKKLTISLDKIKDVSILSRVLIENKKVNNNVKSYSYSVNFNNSLNYVAGITKLIKISNSTYGLGGEIVSSFNKYKIDLKVYKNLKDKGKFSLNKNLKNSVSIKNMSNYTILFKLVSKDFIRSKGKVVEYINFTPESYNREIEVISNKDKKYNYYTSFNLDKNEIKLKGKVINFNLEGPVILKVVSRMLFSDDKNFTESSGYEYNIFDNGALVKNFNEKCIKSRKTTISGDTKITPSKGSTNIIKLGKGIHNITIEDPNLNRDLIFRLYINKNSISIENNE